MSFTPAEIALARDLQQATLAARKRTGLRIGLNVERGRYNLIVTKRRGKRGAWDVIYIQSGLTADEALNTLRTYKPPSDAESPTAPQQRA